MRELILTPEQAKILSEAGETVTVRDPNGHIMGHLEPPLTPDEIAQLKRRAASPGPWYTSAQVQAHLRALQEEWDRTGGFDETYMHKFLAKLRAADPGHFRLAS